MLLVDASRDPVRTCRGSHRRAGRRVARVYSREIQGPCTSGDIYPWACGEALESGSICKRDETSPYPTCNGELIAAPQRPAHCVKARNGLPEGYYLRSAMSHYR